MMKKINKIIQKIEDSLEQNCNEEFDNDPRDSYMNGVRAGAEEMYNKIKNKDNPVPSIDNKHLVNFMVDLIEQLGINTAHGYDGIESNNDILLYQKSIVHRISSLYKTIYSLKRKIEKSVSSLEEKAVQNGVETNNEQPKCKCNHYGFYTKEFCIDCHNEKVFPKEQSKFYCKRCNSNHPCNFCED